jgi:hypothetical protein
MYISCSQAFGIGGISSGATAKQATDKQALGSGIENGSDTS